MNVLTPIQPSIDETTVNTVPKVHVVAGREAVLRLRPLLVELSRRCDQAGAMDDLEYYLARPGFVGKKPVLLLVDAGSGEGLPSSADGVEGAVLLYEQQAFGVGCKVFTADYHGGERTVIAPLAGRSRIAFVAAAALMKRAALLVHVTYEAGEAPVDAAGIESPGRRTLRWCGEERGMTGYLPIEDTFDGTLANLGKHTRRNLRLYRRRAEADLGYVAVDRPEMTKDEFLAMNRMSAYAVSDAQAGWRYDATKVCPERSLFLGLRSGKGEWLSLIGGRTHEGRTIIEWQMNRTDLPEYSLSTLMRSQLIEHEVARGTQRIYFVAGTSHPIRNSMVPDKFIDVTVVRYRVPEFVLRRLVPKDGTEPEFLVRVLLDKSLEWHLW